MDSKCCYQMMLNMVFFGDDTDVRMGGGVDIAAISCAGAWLYSTGCIIANIRICRSHLIQIC